MRWSPPYAPAEPSRSDRSVGDTFDSGVLVGTELLTTANLTDAHAALFRGSWPLAWFVIASLVDGLGAPDPSRFHEALNEAERYGVATGQADAVARVLEATGGTDRPLPFLPPARCASGSS